MPLHALALSILGGWILGVVFTAFRVPLPVPSLMGLVAAAAVLAGQASWSLIAGWFGR